MEKLQVVKNNLVLREYDLEVLSFSVAPEGLYIYSREAKVIAFFAPAGFDYVEVVTYEDN